MGKLINGVYGPIHGKVGPVVGSSWKGEYYIKSGPRKRNKKRGSAEKHNQDNFSSLHYWLQPVIEFLRAGFKGYTPKVEGFNAAKSYALKHAFVGDAGKKILDPALVLVSHGNLPLPSHCSVEKSGDSEQQFTWDTSLTDDASDMTRSCCLPMTAKKKYKP